MDKEFAAVALAPQMFSDSVGTLGEKSLHRSIKYFLEPNSAYHEIHLGRFVADIFKDGKITEIQTGSFSPLAKKLPALLENYPITIVYPIPHKKHIFTVDSTSGELGKGRKSPATGSFLSCFYELCHIPQLLSHQNLSLRLLLVDMDEYRLSEGYLKQVGKRVRSCKKLEQIPTQIVGDKLLCCAEDYASLLPALAEQFTVKELSTAARLSPKAAARGLFALENIGAVERCGKRVNAVLYKKIITRTGENI